MSVKIVSTNPINRNRIVGYERGIELKFDSELTAEASEEDANFLITIDDTLSIVGSKARGKREETESKKAADTGKPAADVTEDVDDEFEDYTITEEDMAEDPTLFEQGLKVGSVIKKKKELTEEQLREKLDEKSKTVLIAEFGETLGVTLSMKKEDIINKIIEASKA